ncbi:hypothetical protein GCM10023220_62930 [Streptomyces ziwulingensis]|uniref:Uncharacterized protein n=1 Tax=Streptomyces ziwulingensis TaxID=1045501 RepID=A0ABP9CWR1_9ACTN
MLAYSWTVDRLIGRVRDSGISTKPEDIDERVREHMRTGS